MKPNKKQKAPLNAFPPQMGLNLANAAGTLFNLEEEYKNMEKPSQPIANSNKKKVDPPKKTSKTTTNKSPTKPINSKDQIKNPQPPKKEANPEEETKVNLSNQELVFKEVKAISLEKNSVIYNSSAFNEGIVEYLSGK